MEINVCSLPAQCQWSNHDHWFRWWLVAKPLLVGAKPLSEPLLKDMSKCASFIHGQLMICHNKTNHNQTIVPIWCTMICVWYRVVWYKHAVLYLKSLVNAWPSANAMLSFLNMIIIYNYFVWYIQFGPDFTECKIHRQMASNILHTTRGFTLKFRWLSAREA